MAYADFTFVKLKAKFGIEQEEKTLFANISPITPSQHLAEDISEAKTFPMMSEKAKSEAIIFPIIKELKRNHPNISVFSGYSFNIDVANELTGVPDFIISAKPRTIEPQHPIFCLVESKNRMPDEGFAQCAAEMYAAKIFNQTYNNSNPPIYGTVTNAFEWIFLKLEDNTIYIDTNRYYLNELPTLLGIFRQIIHTAADVEER